MHSHFSMQSAVSSNRTNIYLDTYEENGFRRKGADANINGKTPLLLRQYIELLQRGQHGEALSVLAKEAQHIQAKDHPVYLYLLVINNAGKCNFDKALGALGERPLGKDSKQHIMNSDSFVTPDYSLVFSD